VYGWGEIDCYGAVQPRTVPTPAPTITPIPTITPTPVPTVPFAENVLSASVVSRADLIRGTFVLNQPVKRPFQAYVVVVLPDGSMRDARTLGANLRPLAPFVPALGAPFSREVLSATVPDGAPRGTYLLVTALFDAYAPVRTRAQAFLDVNAAFAVR
jgi:hypothetical protein